MKNETIKYESKKWLALVYFCNEEKSVLFFLQELALTSYLIPHSVQNVIHYYPKLVYYITLFDLELPCHNQYFISSNKYNATFKFSSFIHIILRINLLTVKVLQPIWDAACFILLLPFHMSAGLCSIRLWQLTTAFSIGVFFKARESISSYYFALHFTLYLKTNYLFHPNQASEPNQCMYFFILKNVFFKKNSINLNVGTQF